MLFSYECPCCGEEINVTNPFHVVCPCCGESSGITLDSDKHDEKEEKK